MSQEDVVYTCICGEAYGEGTKWVDTVTVGDTADISAVRKAAELQCAMDWDFNEAYVICLVVIKGDVELEYLRDNF